MQNFWTQSCGVRGPALAHTHGDCEDPQRRDHTNCACEDCGLTPARWAALVDHESREAGIQIPPPDGLTPPIMERGLNGARPNRYKQFEPLLGDYIDGNPNGLGRGPLSEAWKAWASTATWRV